MLHGAVVTGRPAQLHTEAAGAGSHHRTGIRTFPVQGLLVPATQRRLCMSGQGITHGGESRWNEIEGIVEACRRPAESAVAFVAVTPHGIERVGETIEHGA